MRRVFVAIAATLLAVIPVGSSAAPVAIERNAFAVWRVGSAESDKVIGVAVWTSRTTEQADEVGRFAVWEGLCLDGADDDSCLVSSSGYFSGSARGDEVAIDHAMGSASLNVTRRGRTVDVAWQALTQAEPHTGEVYCGPSEAGTLAIVERAATASGKVFGRRMSESKLHSAELTAGARLCLGGPAELRALLSGGRLELRPQG
jgi:hypothetical protein